MSHFKYSCKSFSHNDQRNFKQIRAVLGVKPANGLSRGPSSAFFSCVVRGLHAYPNSGAVAEQVVGAAVYMSDAECNAIATPLSQLSTFLLVRPQPFALTRQVDKQ
jgi:hypothetical protein